MSLRRDPSMPAATRRLAFAMCLIAVTASPGVGEAQERPSRPTRVEPARGHVEIGGHFGVRVGGLVRVPEAELPLDVRDAATWGAELTWLPSPRFGVGVLFSHQATEMFEQTEQRAVDDVVLRIEHVAFQFRPGAGGFRPTLGASLGRTVFSLAEGGDGEAHPSGSLAVGALFVLGSRADLFTRARFIATLLGGSDRILCGSDAGPCYQTTNDTVLLQLQLVAGVGFRF